MQLSIITCEKVNYLLQILLFEYTFCYTTGGKVRLTGLSLDPPIS